jgi:nucleotide-binding universal stress UspA family protein
MKIARILVPTDFSPRSFAALEGAIELAREHSSEIVLVHVIEPLPYGASRWQDPTNLLEHSAESGRKHLQSFTKRARDLYPNCTGELHFGILHEVISQLARKLSVDLIVLPTRPQHRFLERIFRGLAEKLVCQAPCPVLALQIDGGVNNGNLAHFGLS